MRSMLLAILGVVSMAGCGDGSNSNFDDERRSSGSGDGSGLFSNDGDNGGGCAPNLTGLVRDFRGSNAGGHPDFQNYNNGRANGLVKSALGPDRKPVFNSTNGSNDKQSLTGKAQFDQWYRNTPGVNQDFEFLLPLKPTNGVLSYDNAFFFPIDGRGFGNSGKDANGTERNFHFTFELHLEFVYRGGETFKFTGDDDLWVFFNGKLGIDIGGVHSAESETFDVDARAAEFGFTKGNKYPLDAFQAERYTDASNFRIDTTLEFVNCEKIILPN